MKKITNRISILILMGVILFSSCEQETYDPNLTAAPGGGTVTTHMAYTLSSTTADEIYGRIVFYKYSEKVTLVQIGLYNTDEASSYTATIFEGELADASPATLVALDDVDGATGAFGTSKYFVINADGFYDNLGAYNANVKVVLDASTVAEGDIGANAEPVAEGE